jgi:hypothetical protein
MATKKLAEQRLYCAKLERDRLLLSRCPGDLHNYRQNLLRYRQEVRHAERDLQTLVNHEESTVRFWRFLELFVVDGKVHKACGTNHHDVSYEEKDSSFCAGCFNTLRTQSLLVIERSVLVF